MSLRALFAAVAAALALAACATTPRPSEPGATEAPVQAEEHRVSLGEGSRAGNVEAYLAEARSALNGRNYRRAAEAAREASRLDPSNVEARQVEAQAREAMGDLAGAFPLLESLVRDRLGDAGTLHAYAALAVRRGRGEEALGLFEALLAEAPDDPELNGLAGWVALSAGATGMARKLLEETSDTPVAGRYAVHLARARGLEGDLNAAAAAAQVAAGAKDDPAGAVVLGDVRRAQGLASAAEKAYREALAIEPENYPARVNLGVLRLSQGDAPGAAELFQTAAETRPDAPDAWNNLGLARRALGDFDGAREAYEKALEVWPGFPHALKNLGILNEKYLGVPAAAIPYYDRYLEARGEDEEVQRWRKAAERLAQGDGS